jgi:hypothetical protein
MLGDPDPIEPIELLRLPQAFRLRKKEGTVYCEFRHRSKAANPEYDMWGGMKETTKHGNIGIAIGNHILPQVILSKVDGNDPDFADIPHGAHHPVEPRKLKATKSYLNNSDVQGRIRRLDPSYAAAHIRSLKRDLALLEVSITLP